LIGETTFKNVDEPIKVYRVLLEDDLDDQPGFDEKEKKPKGKMLYFILAGLMIIIIGIVLFWKFYSTKNVIELDKAVAVGVLPFKNLNNDTDQEWLVAGQRETLITELSKLSQVEPLLRVIGSYTMNSFGGSEKSLSDIAREIPVDYLVEGFISVIEDSISLQLRLIQALPEERTVLGEIFTSDISNIFRLYSNIAGQIAQKMNLDISTDEKEKLTSPRTVNPEAYKAYLRGMYHLNMDTPEDKEKGLAYLHEAISIDPGEPFAYAGLAQGYIEIAHGPLGTEDDLIKAEAAANQAIKLDTSLAEIYAVMAEVNLFQRWEWEKAEGYFKKSIELDPNLALTRWFYAWTLFLLGRTEEAIIENERAQKIDPFHPNITVHLGALYYYVGRYEDALREALKSLEIVKDYPGGYNALGRIYLAMGRTDDAIEVHKKLVELYPRMKWVLGSTYVKSGHREEAEKILHELENSEVNEWNAFQLAMMYGALGKMDEAFKWLAYEPHTAWLPWVAVIPDWSKPFRDDPRFEDFLKRLNLPD
jgi:tetratricopeptide (TPR) repeat protein